MIVNNDFVVDKTNGVVEYNDELHVYRDTTDKVKYTSVTTLIHKFTPEFDEEFFSKYKALERLVTPSVFKLQKGGLLKSRKIDSVTLCSLGVEEDDFKDTVQVILNEWKEKKEVACNRGTEIHSKFENLFYKKNFDVIKNFNITKDYFCEKNNYDILNVDKGVFPELLMHSKSKDGLLRIAGQADIIIKDGNDIYVLDFKTNKKIDEKSYFDTQTKKHKTMLYPLLNLMDCNKVHYQLQLSTYAWMLQKMNPDFNIKMLMLIHFDHDNNITNYELEYIPKDVERMLTHYKKQIKYDNAKKSWEKMKF